MTLNPNEELKYTPMKSVISRDATFKTRILKAAIKKHQTVIDDFTQGIKEALESTAMINEDQLDLGQIEFNAEMVQRSNQIANQLAFANDEMKLLYDMIPEIRTMHGSIQLGSVVITYREIFFVSVSIEEFSMDGLKCFGLSTKSPLFKAMEGKKKGDRVSYNYSEYKILDVF